MVFRGCFAQQWDGHSRQGQPDVDIHLQGRNLGWSKMGRITPSDPGMVRRFWERARSDVLLPREPAGEFAFGDSKELADELARLVLNGRKRATAGLAVELEH